MMSGLLVHAIAVTHGAGVTMIHRKCKPWKNRYYDTAFPRLPIFVGPYSALDNSVPYLVLHLDLVHDSALPGFSQHTPAFQSVYSR